MNYTLTLGDEMQALLEEIAREKDVSLSDVLRRAIASYVYLRDRQIKDPTLRVSLTNALDQIVSYIELP
jgi:predicted transcriptional regulator